TPLQEPPWNECGDGGASIRWRVHLDLGGAGAADDTGVTGPHRSSHSMIPELIQRRGAVHGADKETQVARSLRLDAPPSIVELVPEAVARENTVFPIALDGETLTLAAVDPGNLLLVDKLSFILNKKVRLVGQSSEAIWEAIERHYGSSESESVSSYLSEFT